MTIIKINGGFWGWEPIETLERLYPLFEQYTLDPIYEWYGNFVNRKPEWQRSEERQAYQGCGNFGAVSALWELFLYRHR